MKKRMLAIMMSALMAAGICSSVTVYADADSKTLTVGFDAEYPPFGYMDENGEYVGFDLDVAQKFQRTVDAAVVYVNASTRFTDGGEFGYGAEIGISTQKLHARGPMGLHELTTVKYLVTGSGQIRE